MARERMTRRRFLAKAAAAAAGLGILGLGAQCGPTPTPEVIKEIVKETVVVEKEVVKEVPKEVVKEVEKEVTKVIEKVVEVAPKGPKLVKLICHDWVRNEIPIDRMTVDYNDEHPDVFIKYERLITGWDTKILANIRAGKNEHSGQFEMRAFEYALGRAKQGLIAPFNPFIAASTEPGAEKWMDDLLPVIRGQCVLEGNVYGFPIDFDESGIGFRKDYFEAVGVEEPPQTWVELGEVAAAIRAKFKDQEVYGISSSSSWYVFGGPGAMFYNTSPKPFTDEGIVDYTSDEFIAALELCKSWADRDITAAPFGTLTTEAWKAGKLGIYWNQHPLAIWAQKIWGTKAVSNPWPLPLEEEGSGCAVWAISWALINEAPYPQEFVDYLIWLFCPYGEAGLAMNKSVCSTGKLPAYQTAYDEVVKPDESLAWMLRMLEIAQKAKAPPGLTTAAIQQDRQRAWSQKFFAGEVGAKEAMESCVKEIEDEIAKML